MSYGYHETMHLRFVERDSYVQQDGSVSLFRKMRILQQMWISDYPTQAPEWRDVPVEIA